MVWEFRRHPVSLGLRMQILEVLGNDGPMPLRRLLPEIRTNADPAMAVMALACLALIDLDLLSMPIGPSTIASVRS